MFSIGEIIDIAIQIERNGEKVYRDATREVSDPSLITLLQWLADEEASHANWFSDLKDKVKGTVEDARLEEMARSILQDIVGDQSFSLKEANLPSAGNMKELLETALEFEKDTVLFYQMIMAFLEDKETIVHLNAIIDEENRHVRLLTESLESGKDDSPPGVSPD